MMEIDGSYGEGGGQVLRTSVAMSAVTSQAVKVFNIRANRPNPGLAPSHITSIEAVAQIADAEVDGLFPGSKEIVFRPQQLTGGDFEFDVGTAGSIALVLQACLLPAALSRRTVRLDVTGGTDVRWSPPIDYMRLVHAPMLNLLGASCDIEIGERGFYPEGGGRVSAEISPTSGFSCLQLKSPGNILAVDGVAFAQNLPEHVVTRTKHAALKALLSVPSTRIDSDLRKGHSTGAGIVLAARCEHTILGESMLGEKGVRAERLGEECATNMLETARSGATVDEHMLDQILPYLALSEGESVVVAEEMTTHAETNMRIIERFLGRRYETTKRDGLVEVRVV
jgi:RNA 3'-phosphate cyclase